MKEIQGDLFSQVVDAICITTNGTLKKNGSVVAGAGVALTAKNMWPEFPVYLGQLVKHKGNVVHSVMNEDRYWIWSFPVKHNYWEKADIKLIEQSCKQLVDLADEFEHFRLLQPITGRNISVALPRPGCGNGRLKWEDVKPICEKYLDDRFFIVEKGV